jgi:hypothetical protein
MVEGGFCRGFCEKWCADRGLLLVNLWWFADRSWCVGWCFSAVENFPLFSSLFSGGVSVVGCWFAVKVLPG